MKLMLQSLQQATTRSEVFRSAFLAQRSRNDRSRSYGTKYSGRVVQEQDGGKFIAVEVETPAIKDVKGYAYPRRDIICRVCNILKSADWEYDLDEYVHNMGVAFSTLEVSLILKGYTDSERALAFFRWVANRRGFVHDCFSYNRMISILGKANKLDQVRDVVDEMQRKRVKGNISTINILIGLFGNKETRQELDKWCELATKWKLQFNAYTYKALLQAYLRSGCLDKAVETYGLIRNRGYKVDIFALNMLLDALAKADQDKIAVKLFNEMNRFHCIPDVYTYTILIRMMGKKGEVDRCIDLFDELTANGCPGNLITYNTILQVLCKHQKIEKAILIFENMMKEKCRPNEFTYSLLLEGLASAGQLKRLNEIVKLAKNYINRSVYGFLIKTVSQLGHAAEAHKLFCSMWEDGYKADRTACVSMLENLSNAGQINEAIDLLDKMREHGLQIDTALYNILFTAAGKAKMIYLIESLFVQMKENGPYPDILTYNILISSYGRAGDVDRACKLFDEMDEGACKPDVITFNSLINCLGKNGEIDEAHFRFKEMQEMGLSPDVITYSTLIECFGKSGRVEMACTLFEEMLEVGCYPNIVTYNILLDCLEKAGKSNEALLLYERLKQQGLTPDSITYSVLQRLQSGSSKTIRPRKRRSIAGWFMTPLFAR